MRVDVRIKIPNIEHVVIGLVCIFSYDLCLVMRKILVYLT